MKSTLTSNFLVFFAIFHLLRGSIGQLGDKSYKNIKPPDRPRKFIIIIIIYLILYYVKNQSPGLSSSTGVEMFVNCFFIEVWQHGPAK